jgi:hypothetical protein
MNYPKTGLKASYCLPYISVLELIAIFVTVVLYVINNMLARSWLFELLAGTLNDLEIIAWIITSIGVVVLIIMFLITRNYQRGNSFHNYWLSWCKTHDLRQANRIKPQIRHVKVGDNWQNQKEITPAEQAFNYAIQGWFIEQRIDKLTIWLLVPDQVDAQAIFDQRLLIIESNIRHDYHDFTFSPAERNGNYYRISAIKLQVR